MPTDSKWSDSSKALIRQLMAVTSIQRDLGISMHVINHEVLPFVSAKYPGFLNLEAWISSGYLSCHDEDVPMVDKERVTVCGTCALIMPEIEFELHCTTA